MGVLFVLIYVSPLIGLNKLLLGSNCWFIRKDDYVVKTLAVGFSVCQTVAVTERKIQWCQSLVQKKKKKIYIESSRHSISSYGLDLKQCPRETGFNAM